MCVCATIRALSDESGHEVAGRTSWLARLALDIKTSKVNGIEFDLRVGNGMVKATLGDPRFFRRSGPHALAVVASTAGGVADELELLLEGVAPLRTAGPSEVSFLDNRRYSSALDQTSAGAVIVHPEMAARVPADNGTDPDDRTIRGLGAGCCTVSSRATAVTRHSPVRNCGGWGGRPSVGGGRTVVGD